MSPTLVFPILLSICLLLSACWGNGDLAVVDDLSPDAKPASKTTKAHNRQISQQLPFNDRTDFELAQRGFIATIDNATVRNAEGETVYDLADMAFLDATAAETVNPSLWRQAQLNSLEHGLYEVVPGIYQVRSLDLANMTLVAGDSGWIVIDPLTSSETAAAALALANRELGERPVSAVIYTHSHADHFAGVAGIVSGEDVASGRVEVIAPEGFAEEAISENVRAGNIMQRRAQYQFGDLLASGPKGFVSTGLGNRVSEGKRGFITPTTVVSQALEEVTVDGVDIIFQNAPGAEAPAEMVFFFPQFKALCMAEIANHTLHNLYTLRGAKTRDAMAWSQHIQKAMDNFGSRTDVVFSSHHWPTWGTSQAMTFLEKQRDLYKYIHDQTLRLANQGYNMVEIAEQLELPEALSETFANRGYYGTVSHGAKAVYNKYLGWFDGNPSNLHPIPQQQAATKTIEYMGGAAAVMEKAQDDFNRGEYRWVAMVLKHLVFADPDNTQARYLLADSYEQMAYQAESGIWRNFYLSGALELREGIDKKRTAAALDPEIVAGVPIELLIDAMAVRLNGPKAGDADIQLNIELTDTGQSYLVQVRNGVLHGFADRHSEDPSATLKLSNTDLRLMFGGMVSSSSLLTRGRLKVSGNPLALVKFSGLFDDFTFDFGIVTP
jgi:alkyl sulfatase BDS1-like metallo-beta-lactamase superfamily hydrolase